MEPVKKNKTEVLNSNDLKDYNYNNLNALQSTTGGRILL